MRSKDLSDSLLEFFDRDSEDVNVSDAEEYVAARISKNLAAEFGDEDDSIECAEVKVGNRQRRGIYDVQVKVFISNPDIADSVVSYLESFKKCFELSDCLVIDVAHEYDADDDMRVTDCKEHYFEPYLDFDGFAFDSREPFNSGEYLVFTSEVEIGFDEFCDDVDYDELYTASGLDFPFMD